MSNVSYHCSNPGCQCMLNKEDGEFCSEYCKKAAQGPATEEPCACGHSACQPKVHAAPELQSDG